MTISDAVHEVVATRLGTIDRRRDGLMRRVLVEECARTRAELQRRIELDSREWATLATWAIFAMGLGIQRGEA